MRGLDRFTRHFVGFEDRYVLIGGAAAASVGMMLLAVARGRKSGKMHTGITHTRDEAAMRITTKGQVTIPQDIRERFGLLPHTEVRFELDGDRVYLEKEAGSSTRGSELVRHLTGRATVRMSTDQILALTRGEE